MKRIRVSGESPSDESLWPVRSSQQPAALIKSEYTCSLNIEFLAFFHSMA
jgi:hypothetical protein